MFFAVDTLQHCKMYCNLHDDDWSYALLTMLNISMERIISVAEHTSEYILVVYIMLCSSRNVLFCLVEAITMCQHNNYQAFLFVSDDGTFSP